MNCFLLVIDKINILKAITLIQEEDEEDLVDEEIKVKETEEVEANRIEFALESIVGITTPKLMKLLVEINGDKVIILVDNIATHNFIAHELLEKCDFQKEATNKYLMSWVTERSQKEKEVCRNYNTGARNGDIW